MMVMIPKKEKGEFRMIVAMALGWRHDTKLGAKGERAWNTHVADDKDAARPCSPCLHVMEDRQIFLDILRALGFDTLQGLLDFIKSYDMIDPQVLFTELGTQGYDFAPMVLKLGKAVEGPAESRGCGIVARCGRSGSMARGLTARRLAKLRSFVKGVLGCNNSLVDIPATAPAASSSSTGDKVEERRRNRDLC